MSELPEHVVAVAVFGSKARGDDDIDSDTDVLAILEVDDHRECELLRAKVAAALKCDPEMVTVYRRTVFDEMCERGNPFLHHLSREADLIHDPSGYMVRTLADVPVFERYEEHFEKYSLLLSLVESNVESAEGLSECELHLLFMICRNTAILAAIRRGQPEFGRVSGISQMIDHHEELEDGRKLVAELSRWSLVYKRHARPPTAYPVRSQQARFVSFVRRLLQVGKNVCT